MAADVVSVAELLKLGVQVSQATVAKYLARPATTPSQSCGTFLANHVGQIVAADFFVVPTVIAIPQVGGLHHRYERHAA